jgi:hypothetical protein
MMSKVMLVAVQAIWPKGWNMPTRIQKDCDLECSLWLCVEKLRCRGVLYRCQMNIVKLPMQSHF